MLKMVDGTGIIGVDMICPLGVSTPQPPNYDKVEVEGVGSLMLPNSLEAPLERVELLGNSVQGENPSPDNPQEIKSAGRKSKNIFNKNAVKQGYEFGAMMSDAETVKQGWFVSDFMPVKATTYQISGKKTGAGCKLYSKDKVFVKNIQAPFGGIKIEEGIAYFRINGEIKVLDNIQVEEGTVATDYEPYSDTCLLDVKVTGKNLLSNKPENWMIGKKTSWGAVPQTPVSYETNVKNAIATINVKSSTKYTFINQENDKIWVNRIIEQDENGLGYVNHALYVNESLNYKKYNFSTRSNTSNIVFQIKKADGTELLSSDIESNKIMLVEGEANEQTPYEPYTEQTLTLTSDRPITKWDKLVEQDGEYGWLYKHRIVNDLSALVKDSEPIYGKDGEKYFSVSLQGALLNYDYNKIYSVAGMCPKDSKIHYVPKPMKQSVIIYVSDTDTIMTAKEHMHYKVIYETTESQFVPLSQEEQTQLRNLHSYNGTTHITVDSGEVPCGIKLTYRKEK